MKESIKRSLQVSLAVASALAWVPVWSLAVFCMLAVWFVGELVSWEEVV